MNLVIHERTRALRCVWCKDSLTGGASDVRCVCGAHYHAECFDSLAGCATLGCVRGKERGPRVTVQPRPEPAPEEQPAKSAWRWASPAFWLLYVLCQSGGVGVLALLVAIAAVAITFRWAVKKWQGL